MMFWWQRPTGGPALPPPTTLPSPRPIRKPVEHGARLGRGLDASVYQSATSDREPGGEASEQHPVNTITHVHPSKGGSRACNVHVVSGLPALQAKARVG